MKSFLKTNLKSSKQDKEKKKDILETLMICPNIRVGEDGVVYRMATIIKQKHDEDLKKQPFLLGVAELANSENSSKNVIQVLIFQCEDEEEQDIFGKASFVKCGNYFCIWSQFDSSKISLFEYTDQKFKTL